MYGQCLQAGKAMMKSCFAVLILQCKAVVQGINIQPQFFNIAPTGVNIQPQGASIGPSLIVIGPYDTTVAGQVSSHCITQNRPCLHSVMSRPHTTLLLPHCMPKQSP